MSINKIDRIVRVVLALVVASVVACAVWSSATPSPSPPTATFRTTNLVVDQLAGFGTTTPAQQVQIESSGRVCTPGVNDCLPVQITEYLTAAPSISFRRALGTMAAPTPVTPGQFLAQLRAESYTTTGFVGQAGLPQVFMEVWSAETGSPTATSQGSYVGIRSVPIGGVNATMGWKLDHGIGLNGGNVGIGAFDTAAVPAKLTVVSTDTGAGAGTSATAWDDAWATFGSAVNNATGAGLGLGYSSTDDQAVIASSRPGTAFKPIQIFSTIVKVITQPLQVERIINTNDAPSITCNGGALVSHVGGEHMGHIVPAGDTTTCQVRFAHPPASCLCSLALDHVEVATGIGHGCTILVNDLTVTAAPTWALGTFDYGCSSQN